jgi:hypothetical protein
VRARKPRRGNMGAPPADPEYHLDGAAPTNRPPSDRSENHWLAATALALVIGAAGAAAFLALSGPSAPPVLPTSVSVLANDSAAPFPISPEFWGGNIGTSSPLGSAFTGDAAGTPVNYYRWPGGQAGDGINYTSGVLTNATTGAPSNVTTNLTSFTTWCVAIGCHAILQLPAEIDDPATAASYVEYTERVVGFQPSYWEIGNEPALWTHFGVPWSQWNSTQDLNATPDQFAQVVRLYDIAIHAVDPGAPIIGLGGVGTGAFEEAAWIRATVATNGPNLSAVAIHAYPAGTPPNGTATVAEFYSNLTGDRSLAVRVPMDRSAILEGCFTCTGLKLLVDEFGSASSFGSFSPFQAGFPQVPFVAHEIADGLDLGVAGMYLRQVVTPHSGSWFDSATGTTHPLFDLYNMVLPFLGDTVIPSIVAPADPSVAAAATEAGPNGSRSVLIVNGNATQPVTVHLAAALATPGVATVLTWNSTSALPVTTAQPLNASSSWQLPPMSLLMVLTAHPTPPAAADPLPALHPRPPPDLTGSTTAIARPRE